MYIQTEYIIYYGVLLQNISTGLELFWDDFPIQIPSETWTHPPTSTVISDFWKKNYLHSPLVICADTRKRAECQLGNMEICGREAWARREVT